MYTFLKHSCSRDAVVHNSKGHCPRQVYHLLTYSQHHTLMNKAPVWPFSVRPWAATISHEPIAVCNCLSLISHSVSAQYGGNCSVSANFRTALVAMIF